MQEEEKKERKAPSKTDCSVFWQLSLQVVFTKKSDNYHSSKQVFHSLARLRKSLNSQ